MIDLAALPTAAVIEDVSFETVLKGMKTDLIGRFPDIEPVLALESSVAVKIMEVAAYREMVLRSQINVAARANLLAYATGADLDHVGANASPAVFRPLGQTDSLFRANILETVAARSTGSEARYRMLAMGVASGGDNVANAIAYRLRDDPTVFVAILSGSAGGQASAGLVAAVQAVLDLPENRMVNGTAVVRSAVTSIVNVAASLIVTPGQPTTVAANAERVLREAWAAEGGLGRDLTLDWIKARLQVPGVYSVAITQPTVDVVVPPHEAASLGAVTLTIAGEAS